jgi:hypothetical protein
VRDSLFESGGLSFVYGLRLTDGREIVVKLRQPEPRLDSCSRIHAYLWSQGYPCAEPLLPPTPFGALSATVERYLPGGSEMADTPDSPRLFAEALCDLIRTASTFEPPFDLTPPSAWLWWNHNELGIWPLPDYIDVDLNGQPEPRWLDDMATLVRTRLKASSLNPVIGHGDWWQPNLRWLGGRLHAVFDWDSLVYLPEAAIAGAAAAQFSCSTISVTTIAETEAFLDAYEIARGRPWSAEERQIAWAAGIWLVAFNAKKQSFEGHTESMDHLLVHGQERLRRAGLN